MSSSILKQMSNGLLLLPRGNPFYAAAKKIAAGNVGCVPPSKLLSPYGFKPTICASLQRLYHSYAIQERSPTPLISYQPKSLPLYDFFADSNVQPKPSYLFSHGASGFAKRRNYAIKESTNDYYSSQIGEDAYFCRADALGVADGVGGWANTKDASAALYSRKLMHHAFLQLERFDNIDDPYFYHYDDANPMDILQHSYDVSMAEAKREGIVGSTTACIAVLRGDELRIANLGDCGISVIRQNHYAFRSEEQQHFFNFPYQLGTNSTTRPRDAQTFNIKVQKGDVIVVGSDGLFDNLFDKEILAIVNAHVNACTIPASGQRPARLLNFQPQKLADALANRAKTVSEDRRNIDSPFQSRAIHEGFYYQGGKADDISVIVAVIQDNEDSPDRRL